MTFASSTVYSPDGYNSTNHLPSAFKVGYPFEHPSLPVYVMAVCLYGATGLVCVLAGQQFWTIPGLTAVIGALFIGCFVGFEDMVSSLILGGYISVLASCLLQWVNYSRRV